MKQVILSPWGFTQNASDNDPDHQAIGEIGAKAILDTHNQTYRVGPSSVLLYYTSGTSQVQLSFSGFYFPVACTEGLPGCT